LEFWEKIARAHPATIRCFTARIVDGEAREKYAISLGDWLAALDDFRNWLIREAA
jgi:hypothetical protein